MDRNIIAACGALALAGITLSAAQTPSGTTPGIPSQSQAQGRTVTVTGCLMPHAGTSTGMGTTGSTGTAGTTGSGTAGAAGTAGTMAGAQYILTDVEDKGGMMGRSGSTAGTTGSATTGTPGTAGATTGMANRDNDGDHDRYLLRAEGSAVNLSQHVNHKVEITGRVASMDMAHGTGAMGTTGSGTTGTGTTGTGTTGTGTTGSGTTGTTSRPAGSGAMDAAMPTLTVSAVKMIAATCK